MLGDHQPAAVVSGPGASWRVPVHVFARNPAILPRLLAGGFEEGLRPIRTKLGGTEDLTGLLLRAFDTPSQAAAVRSDKAPGRGSRQGLAR